MSSFMKVQVKKIEIDKWCEGCGIHSDPGESYILDWINKNAQKLRQGWEKSCCKRCNKWQICGHEVKISCDDFEEQDLP